MSNPKGPGFKQPDSGKGQSTQPKVSGAKPALVSHDFTRTLPLLSLIHI